MCKKANCAYLKNDEYCLMHKAMCNVLHPEARCHDGVTKAPIVHPEGLWRFPQSYDQSTRQGRFAFRTRNHRRAEVYSQCMKKERYPDEARAHQVARLRSRSGAGVLRVYYCAFCEGYHITKRCNHVNDNDAA